MQQLCAGQGQDGHRSSALFLRGESCCGTRFIMILNEAHQFILIATVCKQMQAHGFGVVVNQSVIQPLVIAVVEALLLQLPLKAPVCLGHEQGVGIFFARRLDYFLPVLCPGPRSGALPPGLLEYSIYQEHGHVTAHAVALGRDRAHGLHSCRAQAGMKGIYLRGSFTGIGTSRAEELRASLKSFRDSGKFVVAHTQGMLGLGGPSAYHSITAAEEIWMQPGSDFMINGVSFETEFLKGLFEKIGLTPQIYALYEYKNAPNSYNETAYTEPHREAMTALATSPPP